MNEDNVTTVNINLAKIIIALVLIISVAYGLYLFFREQSVSMSSLDMEENEYPVQCEQGSWIEFPVKATGQKINFQGKVHQQKNSDKMLSEDEKYIFSASEGRSLVFFNGHQVEVEAVAKKEGSEKKPQEAVVAKIRCIGQEAEQVVVTARKDIMNYVSDNISQLIQQNPKQGQWAVEEFAFVDNSNLYVYYYSDALDQQSSESGALLVNISGSGDYFKVKELARLVPAESEEDEDKVIKGEDIFKDNTDLVHYQFDDETEQWLMVD